ncbi:hypothetical protein U6X42_12360, partial [Cutibacterium acnes]
LILFFSTLLSECQQKEIRVAHQYTAQAHVVSPRQELGPFTDAQCNEHGSYGRRCSMEPVSFELYSSQQSAPGCKVIKAIGSLSLFRIFEIQYIGTDAYL